MIFNKININCSHYLNNKVNFKGQLYNLLKSFYGE